MRAQLDNSPKLVSYTSETAYLVEEKGFFSTSQHLLKIQDSPSGGITLQAFNGPSTISRKIHWEHFLAALGTTEPNELVIHYIDGASNSGSMCQSQTERSRVPTEELLNVQQSTLRLFCTKRNLLVCHLNTACTHFQPLTVSQECLYAPVHGLQCANLNAATTTVTLYDASIRLSYQVPSHPTIVEKPATLQLNAFGFNQSSDDAEELHSFHHSNSTEMNLPIETTESPEQDTAAFQASTQRQSLNSILLQSPTSKPEIKDGKMCTQMIMFCEIQRIFQVQNWVILVTHAKKIECISLSSQSGALEFLDALRTQQSKVLLDQRLRVDYFHLTQTEQQNLSRRKLEAILTDRLSHELGFMQWPELEAGKKRRAEADLDSKGVFKIKVDTYNDRFNILFKDQALMLDESNIYELESNQSQVDAHKRLLRQMPLTTLKRIVFVNCNVNFNLVLLFDRDVQLLIKTVTYEDRERLISALLTLRSFHYQGASSKPDLLVITANYDEVYESRSPKIHGYQPVYSEDRFQPKLTSDFETEWLGHMLQYDDFIAENVLANCHFSTIMELRSDPSAVFDCLADVIQRYVDTEIQNRSAHEKALLENQGCKARPADIFLPDDQSFTVTPNLDATLDKEQKVFTAFGDVLKCSQDSSDHSMMFPGDNQCILDQSKIQQVTQEAVKALNILRSLLNSSVFFSAILGQRSLISNLTRLVKSKDSTVALMAAQVIRGAIHFNGRNASSVATLEARNKQMFLYSTTQDSDDSESDDETLFVLPELLSYLEDFERCYEASFKIYSLHMTAIYSILSSVLQQRESTTPPEILNQFYRKINSSVTHTRQKGREEFKTFRFLSLLDKLSLCHAPASSQQTRSNAQGATSPEAQDNRISLGTFMSYRASMTTFQNQNRASNAMAIGATTNAANQYEDGSSSTSNEHFAAKYLISMLLCQNLTHVQSLGSSTVVHEVTDYLLGNTIQFIWHLQLQELTAFSKQKAVSIDILALMLSMHRHCPELLDRILPQALRKRTPSAQDSQRRSLQKWKEFFTRHFSTPLNNARELWSDEMCKELTCELAGEIQAFSMLKQEKVESEARRSRNQSMNSRRGTSTHKSFSGSGDFQSGSASLDQSAVSKPIKWNYAEFEVRYEKSLYAEYYVGGYYLKRLLETSGETPIFKRVEKIGMPRQFWDQLQVAFMASVDRQEQHQILMTLCQLYKEKWGDIGQIKSLGYWMRLIEKQEYSHCHFLLLQLFHIALCELIDQGEKTDQSLEKAQQRHKCVRKNMEKFIKEHGFLLLHNCINLVFKELRNLDARVVEEAEDMLEGTPRTLEVDQDGYARPLATEETKDIFDGEEKVNFTVNRTHRMYFRRNSKNINMAILSLKIFDVIFTNMQFIDNLPMSRNREYMLREYSLATLTQTILLENADLTREVLTFIEKHLSDHYTFYLMRQTGMIEFLILCLSTRNNFRALRLLKIFQQVCLQFNQQLKLGGELAANDLKMILEDKQKREKEPEPSPSKATKVAPAQERLITSKAHQKATATALATSDMQHVEHEPLLGDSIFLRYLPVPFIKYLYEYGEQSFLEIYRRHDYKHPILIWNARMRCTLEDKIKANAQKFLGDLRAFAKRLDNERNPEKIEIYRSRLTEIVKYEQIENEVRCGRYYLGVWTSLHTDFTIAEEQEPEFQQKMQAELRQCIYEENMKNIGKIIVLFKMCWLTLRKFKSKRINSLNEIKRILLAICKPQSFENMDNYNTAGSQAGPPGLEALNAQQNNEKGKLKFPYNSETSDLLYYGTKIFYEAIKEVNNKTEILTMNGVEIMSDIVSFILSKAKKKGAEEEGPFGSRSKAMSEIHEATAEDSALLDSGSKVSEQAKYKMADTADFKPTGSAAFQEIDVTAIEAETLLLSMKAIDRLLKEDTQSFIDIRLDQRIEIFTQMTQILNLSVQLCDYIDERELEKHPLGVRKQNTSGSQSFILKSARGTIEEQRDQSSIHNQDNGERGLGTKRRKKPLKKQAEESKKGDGEGLWDQAGEKGDQDGDDNKRDFDPKQRLLDFLKSQKQRRDDSDFKRRSTKESRVDSTGKETYVIALILKIAKSIFEMMNHIAYQPQLHPELIASGLVWQAIRHAFFDLKVYFDLTKGVPVIGRPLKMVKKPKEQNKTLKKILDDSTQSVMLIVSFAQRFKESGTETMQFKNLTKKQEREIIQNFHQSIQRIFTKRMQEELFCKFTVDNGNKMDVAGKMSGQSFLKLFSVASFSSPELIWNTDTRQELHDVLQLQISDLIAEENNTLLSLAIEQKPAFQLGRPRQHSEVSDVTASTGKPTTVSFDKFCLVLLKFEYQVNREMLRVDEVFVHNFIHHDFKDQHKDLAAFTVDKKESFAKAIIDRLNENQEEVEDESLVKSREKDRQELVHAFRRLIVDFDFNIRHEAQFSDYFNTLCRLIQLDLQKGSTNSSMQQAIAMSVLDIVKHIVRKRLRAQAGDLQEENRHFEFLLGCQSGPVEGTQPNKAMLNLLIDVLEQQGDSKECIQLKQHVVGILDDVIKIRDYVLPLFIEQGILVFLLKILFDPTSYRVDSKPFEEFKQSPTARTDTMMIKTTDSEVEEEIEDLRSESLYSRQTLLDIILRVEQEQFSRRADEVFVQGNAVNFEDTGVLKAFLPQNFLREIRDKMDTDGDNLEVIHSMQKEWLSNFDKQEFESVFVLWNNQLRVKCQTQVLEQCSKIRNEEQFNLSALGSIDDPKLMEEERVEDIILRVYNKTPNVYIKIGLEDFILKLVDELEKVQQSLYQLRSSENVAHFTKPINLEEEQEDPGSQQTRRKFHYVCHQASLRLSALLFSIEQLLNDDNPNVMSYRNNVRVPALMSFRSINDKVFRQMKVWLQSPVFLDAHIPYGVRITFLQVLYLVVSAKGALEKLRGETLLNFISDMIAQVASRSEDTTSAAATAAALTVTSEEDIGYIQLEECLIFMTISKLLFTEFENETMARKGQKIWEHLIEEISLKQLVSIAEHRSHCESEVKYIYAKLLQRADNLVKKVSKFGSLQPMDTTMRRERDREMQQDLIWRTREGQKYVQRYIEKFVGEGRSLHEANERLPIASELATVKYEQFLRPKEDPQLQHESVSNQSHSRSIIEETIASESNH